MIEQATYIYSEVDVTRQRVLHRRPLPAEVVEVQHPPTDHDVDLSSYEAVGLKTLRVDGNAHTFVRLAPTTGRVLGLVDPAWEGRNTMSNGVMSQSRGLAALPREPGSARVGRTSMRGKSPVIVVWILLGLVVFAWLTGLAALWIGAWCRHRTAASRHSAWANMVSDLPPGSRLAGIETDSRMLVEIGLTTDSTQESRGGR